MASRNLTSSGVGGMSAVLVAHLDERLRTFQVIRGPDPDLEVAGSEMADGSDVSSEPLGERKARRIDLQIDEQHLRLWMHFDAGKVLDPSESEVELRLLLRDVISKSEEVVLEQVIHVLKRSGCAGKKLPDTLVCLTCTCTRLANTDRLFGQVVTTGRTVHELQDEEPVVVEPVAQQLNIAGDLLHGIQVVLAVVAGDAQ